MNAVQRLNGVREHMGVTERKAREKEELKRQILDAAHDVAAAPSDADLDADVKRFDMQPLFVRGISDSI